MQLTSDKMLRGQFHDPLNICRCCDVMDVKMVRMCVSFDDLMCEYRLTCMLKWTLDDLKVEGLNCCRCGVMLFDM